MLDVTRYDAFVGTLSGEGNLIIWELDIAQ